MNRKSRTRFPLNLRWTAYVAPKPPKGAQEEQKVSIDTLKAQYYITLHSLALLK